MLIIVACVSQFEECLRRELGLVQKDKAAFIKEFSESDYNAIEAGWKVSSSPVCLNKVQAFLRNLCTNHCLTCCAVLTNAIDGRIFQRF